MWNTVETLVSLSGLIDTSIWIKWNLSCSFDYISSHLEDRGGEESNLPICLLNKEKEEELVNMQRSFP